MLSFLHLKPFYIYNIILLFVFSILVNSNSFFFEINLILYICFHLIIIYLGIYYFRKLLYFIFFLYGLGLDIFWLNEIGPHLFVFMLYLIFVNFTIKYLYSLSSIKVYILIIILQFILVTLEMIITQVLFKINIDLVSYIKIIIFTIIFSYPLFILFLRIDKI